jgi:hypothetical protein
MYFELEASRQKLVHIHPEHYVFPAESFQTFLGEAAGCGETAVTCTDTTTSSSDTFITPSIASLGHCSTGIPDHFLPFFLYSSYQCIKKA